MKKILFIITGTPYPITSGRQIRTYNFVQALAQDSELYILYQNWEVCRKFYWRRLEVNSPGVGVHESAQCGSCDDQPLSGQV
jgi:hypothetical protein